MEKAKALNVTLEWLPNGRSFFAFYIFVTFSFHDSGDVRSTSGVLPAVKDYDGGRVFFNSIVAAFTGWKDTRNDPEKAVVF